MGFAEDPGGNFDSEVHRRILGALALPDDSYGWTPVALHARVAGDAALVGVDQAALEGVLSDLSHDGHAVERGNGAWQMTEQGHESLKSGIVNEPEPGAPIIGPAMVLGGPAQVSPTQTGGQ